MNAIEVRGLVKSYRGHVALAGLDLTVPKGSAYGLIGANGAGKTTCVKALLDVVRPTAGEVLVFGGHPSEKSIRARIGYLPERLELPRAWTASKFLESVARLKGVASPMSESFTLLDRVGLGLERRRKLKTFSKGMKQKVGLAAALVGRPALLILDEPTDGIDPLGRVLVRRLLREEQQRGASLFLNSHLLSETERICDRVGILAGGRMVREDSTTAIRRGSNRWTVRIEPHEDLPRLGLSPGPEPWTFHLDAEDPQALNRELDRLRAQGVVLLEVVEEMRSLEDVLSEVVEAA